MKSSLHLACCLSCGPKSCHERTKDLHGHEAPNGNTGGASTSKYQPSACSDSGALHTATDLWLPISPSSEAATNSIQSHLRIQIKGLCVQKIGQQPTNQKKTQIDEPNSFPSLSIPEMDAGDNQNSEWRCSHHETCHHAPTHRTP